MFPPPEDNQTIDRTDDFVDARTGRPMHVTVRVTKTLGRADGGWVFAAAK